MSDSENSDASVTWEDFFGTSTDLGPSVLGMFDTLLEQRDQQQSSITQNSTTHVRSNSPSLLKQCLTANLQHSATTATNISDTKPYKKQNSFISLSPNVKRILSNLNDADVSCDSEIISENSAFSRNAEGRATLPNFRSSNVSIKYETKKDNRCSLPRLNGPQFVIDRFSNSSLLSIGSVSYEGLHEELRMADEENIGAGEIWDKKAQNGSGFLQVPRPLSIASISSSTSTSSGSSCTATKNSGTNAYLASIESLDDDTDNEVLSRDSSTRSNDRRIVEDSVRVENGKRGSVANSRVVTVSAPVPPAVRPRYLDPQLSSVQRVLMEIVDTEAIYVTDLAQVIQGYLEPWEQDPPFSTDPDQQTQIISELFNNLRDVHALACSLLQKLRAADGHATEVARAFLAVEGGFEPYTQYCTGYPVTVRRLTELMRNEEAARAFRDRQQRLGHPLQLGAYLLKPVQRILKYHLLLQKLMKECDTSEVEDIRLALSTMTGIAQHINDMKRKHEHAVRVQEIQSLLYGWNGEDLTTFGELCAEGTFRMHGAKALRHVFLFDKMLLLAKNREDGILNYKFHILCSNLMLIESVPGEPLSFHVVPFDNPRLQYTLTARNLEQKREWTFQLKRVIIENYHTVIPSHARQLVMEIGQFRSEDDIVIEKSNSSKKQYSAPEYLQKRRMDRERRESEASLRLRLRKSRKSNIPDETECETSSDKRDRSQSRSRSREGLSKFSNWRRKSEPVADEILNCLNTTVPVTVEEKSKTLSAFIPQSFQINQYNHKTIPKKISKLRKARGDRCQNSTFYTDLFDFSNCDEVLHISESTDSLDKVTEQKIENESVAKQEVIEVTTNNEDDSKIEETVENIVSQLLMQNQEFQRILKKQRKEIGLRNRINKTPLSNPKPKIEEHRDSTDSEADVEKSKEILNNSSIGKNVVEKPLNLKTNNLEQEKSLKNINQSNDRTKCTTDDKNNINKLNLKEDLSENKNNVNYVSSELILNPSSPEIWLKHQTDYVTHSTPKKSDSLPRSFETLNEKFNDEVNYLNRDGKVYNDRPLTIASENTDEIETLILEKEENSSNSTFITRSPSNSTLCSKSEFNLDISSADTTTEIIYDIPNKNNIDSHNIHPEYKIYRPSVNLVSFKISLSKSSRQKSKSIDIETDIEKNVGSTVRNSRSLLQRFRRIVSEDNQLAELKLQSKSTEYINHQHVNCLQRSTRNLNTYGEKPQKLPIYKQGSSSLGARIAQSDYANPSELFLETEQGNVLINKLSMRPESILSNSSMITSSSEGFQSDEVTKVDTEETGNRETNDCFYEKQMDALETIVDNEVSRDSAIYSSDEISIEPIVGKIKHGEQMYVQKIESRIVRNNHIVNVESPFKNKQIKRPTKLPPPIPVKPEIITVKNRSRSSNSGRITDKCDTRPTSIVEKLQSLQINALENGKFEINKAVAQRRKEFQGNFTHVDSVSRKSVPVKNEMEQNDFSKQCTVDQSNIVPSKGWVKRVVEKFE